MGRLFAFFSCTCLLSACQGLRDLFTCSIPAMGGRHLTIRLPALRSTFQQADPRWSHIELGTSGSLLGTHGCVVCSTAMAATSLGVKLTPPELNNRLNQHHGFQPQGWLVWNAVHRVTDGMLAAEYHKRPRHDTLDAALMAGAFPVIAFPLPNGARHWVLVVGKDGHDYLVRDPLTEAPASTVRLSTLTERILAMRIVKKTGPASD